MYIPLANDPALRVIEWFEIAHHGTSGRRQVLCDRVDALDRNKLLAPTTVSGHARYLGISDHPSFRNR
jgi:hypothetical protein